MQANAAKRASSLRLAIWLVASLSAIALVGCGQPKVIDIEPRFTSDGQPLADASIMFVRSDDEGGRAAFGVTNAEGVAQMTSYAPNDGICPGEYSVVVIKAPDNAHTYEEVEVDASSPEDVLRKSAMNLRPETRSKRVRTLLPEEYSDPGTTPLECTIDSSTEELVFDIPTK